MKCTWQYPFSMSQSKPEMESQQWLYFRNPICSVLSSITLPIRRNSRACIAFLSTWTKVQNVRTQFWQFQNGTQVGKRQSSPEPNQRPWLQLQRAHEIPLNLFESLPLLLRLFELGTFDMIEGMPEDGPGYEAKLLVYAVQDVREPIRFIETQMWKPHFLTLLFGQACQAIRTYR